MNKQTCVEYILNQTIDSSRNGILNKDQVIYFLAKRIDELSEALQGISESHAKEIEHNCAKISLLNDRIAKMEKMAVVKCDDCWPRYPIKCHCGGWIHKHFFEEHLDGTIFSYFCDRCGNTDTPDCEF